MLITPDSIKTLQTTLSAAFQDAFGAAPTTYEQVAMTVPSSGRSNTYAWLGQFPQLREWLNDRIVKDIAASDYAIKNKEYESTVGVLRADIDDDNLGGYGIIAAEMGRAAKQHPDFLLWNLILDGMNQLCYDGKPFFAPDHEMGGATVSNFTDGNGPMWVGLDLSRAMKPFILQTRRDYAFNVLDSLQDEEVFMRNKIRFGVDGRSNVGFGFWQLAQASKGALDPAAFQAMRARVIGLKSDEGRTLGTNLTHVAVGPSLLAQAEEMFETERTTGGKSNTLNGKAKIILVPELG